MECISILGWQARLYPQSRYNFSDWVNLKEVNLDGSYFEHIPILPSGLRRLSLSRVYRLQYMDSGYYAWADLPLLTYFDSSLSPGLSWAISLQLVLPSMQANNLRRLYMTDNSNGIDLESFPLTPSVIDLSLQRLQESEDIIMKILRKFPNLRQVDLSDTKVTGVTIKELMARNNPRLERLRLWGCLDISPDAVEYARNMGTKVDYKASAAGNHQASIAWRSRDFEA